ncbi:MAG: SsrA-binding protein SmpB [Planctomycetes bacterium]|nr:SsrA-binding protein SmpB [Planctomycetota bacterium]
MSKQKSKKSGVDKSLILRNKKAFHEYEVLETLECGIELCGTEVKSLRDHKVNFAQTFATVRNGELMLMGLHISPYEMGNRMNHDPERRRRLLAHKREIHKLSQKINEKGLTLVPLRLYWKFGRCKVELGIVRGKQIHDKRDAKRDKDVNRQIERDIRESRR